MFVAVEPDILAEKTLIVTTEPKIVTAELGKIIVEPVLFTLKSVLLA